MKHRILLYFVVFLFIGCIEPIEFENLDIDRVIVVDGLISNIEETQTIKIRYSSFTDSQVFQAVSNCDVSVIDQAGNVSSCVESEPGIYTFNGAAESGNQYALEIRRNNILLAKTALQDVPPPFSIDSVTFEENLLSYTNEDGSQRNLWSIEAFGETSKDIVDQDYYLRFGGLETVFMLPEIDLKNFPPPINCYIYNYETKPVINTFFLEKGTENIKIKSKVLQKQTTYDFAYVYSVKTDLYSMNESTYEYWSQLEILTEQSGNITDQIPAQFNGNIEATSELNIIGNFSVVNKSSDFVLIRRSDLFRPPLKLCGNIGGPYPNNPSDFCWSCLGHPGATSQLPSYW